MVIFHSYVYLLEGKCKLLGADGNYNIVSIVSRICGQWWFKPLLTVSLPGGIMQQCPFGKNRLGPVTGNLGIRIINHPPVITIDSWYESFPVMGGLWLLYPHYTSLYPCYPFIIMKPAQHGQFQAFQAPLFINQDPLGGVNCKNPEPNWRSL